MQSYSYQLYEIALSATVVLGLLLSFVLWLRSALPGLKPLVFYTMGACLWVAGHLLISSRSGSNAPLGLIFLDTLPITSAFFVHFALSFVEFHKKYVLQAVYAVSAIVSLAAIISGAGWISSWLSFAQYYRYDSVSLAVVLYSGALLFFAHAIIAKKSFEAPARKVRQTTMIIVSMLVGAVGVSGTFFADIGVDTFPYTVYILPAYPVLLVYGFLRYEYREVNRWAERAVSLLLSIAVSVIFISVIVVLLAKAGVPWAVSMPLYHAWAIAAIASVAFKVFTRPAARISSRVIFPDAPSGATLFRAWGKELSEALGWRELSDRATMLLSEHAGHTSEVKAAPVNPGLYLDKPGVLCERANQGWRYTLSGWENASPGRVKTVEGFAELVVQRAEQLDFALKYAEIEKAALSKEHSEGLSRLSSSIATELRAPLNVIGMASATCDDATRKEIASQIQRAQKVIADLLAYSGTISIEKKELLIKDEIDYVLSFYQRSGVKVSVDVPVDLFIWADPLRLQQVLFCLVDSSLAALKNRMGARVLIYAAKEMEGVRLYVLDNGPGVPEKALSEVFRPFSQARPGVSGLGLAIVKRLVDAHGGSAALKKVDNWTCAFELYFPSDRHEFTHAGASAGNEGEQS